MPIQFPSSRKEVSDRMKTDVQSELPESNPFLRNSFLGALITGCAGRIYDFYLQLQNMIRESFPQTATGEYLDEWGELVKITRNAATTANGNITINGTVGIEIPINTIFGSFGGNNYKSTESKEITANNTSISSLDRSGFNVVATTTSDHSLSPQITVTISGANESAYNGTFIIDSVPQANQFSYVIDETPSTPATGTIVADDLSTVVPVLSDGFGEDQNLDNGAQLALATPISGIAPSGYVQHSGIGGGTDAESDDDYSERVIERWQNPVAHFNVSEIINKAKEVAGVTRVWVDEITPNVGQVTILFVRDNDSNIIPSPQEVIDVKGEIVSIKPANTSKDDVIVLAPTPITVDFTFVTLVPNTVSMQDSIKESLAELFSENTNPGEDLQKVAYDSAIWQTIDSETGSRIESFSLSTPSGDVVILTNELAVLGQVTYP